MSFKSIAERDSLEAELSTRGYATRQLPGLNQPKYGFYKKPTGEIVRLPIGPDRLQFYKAKGFEYLAPEGETTIEKLRQQESFKKAAREGGIALGNMLDQNLLDAVKEVEEPKPKPKRTAKRKTKRKSK